MSSTPAKHRILVAEDVRAISARMVHALEALGFEVAVARDGEECLAMVGESKPDLLVLDLMMPRLGGMAVLERLRADPATRDLGVIVCTAKDFGIEMKRATELGAAGFIVKPFAIETLEEKVLDFFSPQDGTKTKPPPRAGSRPATSSSAGPGDRPAVYRPDVDRSRPRVVLWGTRGSIPVSGPKYVRHGGNTSCMEFIRGDQRLVFDAGSGIRELAGTLARDCPRRLHLFITHTHWDHIQGFPFFTPIYRPDCEIIIYGERGFGKDPEALLGGQLDRDYFPIEREDLRAKLDFRFLTDDPIEIDGIRVSRDFTLHPGATVAFRIDCPEGSVAYVPDNEFLRGYLGSPEQIGPESEDVIPQEPLIRFLDGVDVLLHEAQYTADEYPHRIGWGHSNLSNACTLAKLARVKKWIVIHHDPAHDDAFLEEKLNVTRRIMRDIGHPIEVVHGHDGMVEYL